MFGHLSDRQLLEAIHERVLKMATIDDLNAAVAAMKTAVTDATSAFKDIANKLSTASSLNPADVESAANQINALAAGLEAAVQGAGEPITGTTAPVTSTETAPSSADTAPPTAPEATPDTPAPATTTEQAPLATPPAS
jgi:hypothetical protein